MAGGRADGEWGRVEWGLQRACQWGAELCWIASKIGCRRMANARRARRDIGVCVSERGKEGEREWTVRERERERERVCVCVCV